MLKLLSFSDLVHDLQAELASASPDQDVFKLTFHSLQTQTSDEPTDRYHKETNHKINPENI